MNLSVAEGFDAPRHDAALRAGLERLTAGLGARRDLHQVAMTVQSMDDRFRWSGATGAADPSGRAMSVDLPAFVASVTKLFIATAILQLYEQERLALFDRLSDHLPAGQVAGLHRMGGRDLTDRITLRHLLAHATGLPDYLDVKPRGGKSLFARLVDGEDADWSLDDAIALLRASGRPLFEPQDLDAPRPRVSYSDTNFRLLIAVIEAVTGRPLGEVFHDGIFAPLGLKHTFLPGPGMPDAAVIWNGDRPFEAPRALEAFHDLFSTPSELVVFLRALLNGRLFEHPDTVQLMQARWNRFGFSFSPVGPGWPMEYGLGMLRYRLPRLFTPFRPVPAVIGHTGVTGSWVFYCPKFDLLLAGNVCQIGAAPLPFRFVPRLLRMVEDVARKGAT